MLPASPDVREGDACPGGEGEGSKEPGNTGHTQSLMVSFMYSLILFLLSQGLLKELRTKVTDSDFGEVRVFDIH